ncbi:uncharacterized protein RHIMIDRAFT_293879 [Rhizopus microsporus ATCC 52813]|uniref:Uncharacterized protein n=1 Tax=Rhizopus microsporus ATCC 52813 TaxID=1340429 RepID=A0A2G4SMA3_RHIZD|nr:uncharacterized protein RHIMIDRAFT_293879 [Rhizopus microsporus ATCC 52813]PHZ09904.1 hypothetical protein RHIMIDRAFT_293879 [Rhizopus microsporus ATCC 52813]
MYLVDIQRENEAIRKWTETVNENPLIKVFVKIDPIDDERDYEDLYYEDL